MTDQDGYTTIKIPLELTKELDFLIGTRGFRSRAEIVKEALRHLLLKYSKLQMLEHYNLDERGVKILDHRLDRIVEVFFKPVGIRCGHCDKTDCRHIQYALSLTSVQKVIRSKRKDGWDLPEV